MSMKATYPYRMMRIKTSTKNEIDSVWRRGVKLDELLLDMVRVYREHQKKEREKVKQVEVQVEE